MRVFISADIEGRCRQELCANSFAGSGYMKSAGYRDVFQSRF